MADRKLTPNELKRNGIYDKIAKADLGEGMVAIGNVKQGMLVHDTEADEHIVVKVILKKDKVDYDKEQLERPTEQPKDEEEEGDEE